MKLSIVILIYNGENAIKGVIGKCLDAKNYIIESVRKLDWEGKSRKRKSEL